MAICHLSSYISLSVSLFNSNARAQLENFEIETFSTGTSQQAEDEKGPFAD